MSETSSLLDGTIATIRRYVVLVNDAQAIALALWALHTWAFDGAHATPYISITSPEKRTGKTRLLEVLELLVREPFRVASASEAAIYRTIEKHRPTLMLDEIDAIFATSSSDRNEGLRSLLNSGVRAGAAVSVCVGQGHDVKRFSTFCPKVLAGIDNGRLPETIRDRSIEIRMHRKTSLEPVDRFQFRKARDRVDAHREAAAAWGDEHLAYLYDSDPDLPEALNDRMAEAWEPLLAIADLAGVDWPSRAREAATQLSSGEATDEVSHGTRLLAATRAILNGRTAISTHSLLKAINGDDEMPFGDWRDGRGIDHRTLARHLRPYGIYPRTIRFDAATILKGYRREWFVRAWERYLPEPAHASQPSGALEASPQTDHGGPVTDVTDDDAAGDAAVHAYRELDLGLNEAAERERGS
jgi:hypothetical protein